MQSKYNSRCKQCRTGIRVGDLIYWSKGTGALCTACGNKEKVSPVVNASAEWRIDWSDLKQFVLGILENGSAPPEYRMSSAYYPIRTGILDPSPSFQGFTRSQLQSWLRTGYITETLKGIADFTPPIREKRRLQFLEEGDEFHLDLAQSGYDNYMSTWTKREVIPGIRVDLQTKFSGATDAAVVNAYNAWTNQMIYAFDSSGIDAEVNFVYEGIASPSKYPHYTVIRVKKENEAVDFLSISPMLSPAAFRGFAFCALGMQGKEHGFAVGSGISSRTPGTHEDWQIEVDESSRKISISTLYHPRSFPAERLTQMLRDALKQMQNSN